MAAPQTLIAKGDGGGTSVYITNGITKRLLAPAVSGQAAWLVSAQLAIWDAGQPYVVPQAILNDIRTV